jgi:RNA polymerase primary sigma factor
METNKRNRNKEKWLKERTPKRSFRSGPRNNVLILSDELDVHMDSELSRLGIGNERFLARKEEEAVEYELESFGKAVDPVGIYLKEIGSFPLLTREGEVEIAKRIESAKWEVLSALLNCPIVVKEIIRLGGALRTGKIEIREITNEIDDKESSVEEEQIQKKRVLSLINNIQRGGKSIQILQVELRLRDKEAMKKKIQDQIWKKQSEMIDTFKEIHLREKQINKILQKLKKWDTRMEKATKEGEKYELATMEVECGLTSDHLKEVLKTIEKGEARVKESIGKGQPETGHLHCQEIHKSGTPVS